MYKLKIISSTVRPTRKGPLVANWVAEQAKKHPNFEVEVIDLGELNLPMMNEPNHPSKKEYTHEYTKKWSETIDEADAFIFVTAEYNHNFPAPLHNALDYLVQEWRFKPAGIVSYGGISAGTRAANALKTALSTMKMVPLGEAVNFAMFDKNIDENGKFTANDVSEKAADAMLTQLARWAKGLQTIEKDK